MNYNQYFSDLTTFKNWYNNKNRKSLFNVISINMRSISSIDKFNLFKTLVNNLPKLPDVICVQETWFREDLTQIYKIAGYKAIHCCRFDSYGGTSIFIREGIQCKTETIKSHNFIESITLTLTKIKSNGKALKLITFYRSPKCNETLFLLFLENLLSCHGRSPCILVGDSNVDVLANHTSEGLVNTLSNYDFRNCHSMISHPKSKTSIDHVYSNINETLHINSIECNLSDHNLIHCDIQIESRVNHVTEKIKVFCNREKAARLIRDNILALDVSDATAVDINSLISIINNAENESTTRTKEKIKHNITPWINGNLGKLIDLKDKLLRNRRKNRGNEKIESMLKSISKVVKKAYNNSMNNFYIYNVESTKSEPARTWNFLNETLGRSNNREVCILDDRGEIIQDDLEKAEVFNNYFLKTVQDTKSQIIVMPNDHFNSLRTLRRALNTFHLFCPGVSEFEGIITKLSSAKSRGHDNISSGNIIECRDVIIPYLIHVFSNMLMNSTYPEILKIHKVIPVPKEANTSTVDKYRPISVLSVLNNIFERVLHDQLSEYLECNVLLSKFQYGFRKGCGTEEAAVNVINTICKGLDDGFKGVVGVFYDLSKAFDLIDHEILINKLSFYGVRGTELALIKNYLCNRRQYVCIKGNSSNFGSVKYGVPQGSVLGPLLFKIYLNDIANLDLTGKIFMYADDICLIYPYIHETVVKAYIARDAALISEFIRINKLFLNATKTKVMRFKPYSDRNTFSVYINGEVIEEVDCIKYLGLHIQNNLAWDKHIKQLKAKTSRGIGLLYKFKNKFKQETKFLLYRSLIESYYNYMPIVYGFNNSTQLKSLQRMQNKSLRIVANLPATYSTVTLYRDIFQTVLPITAIYKKRLLLYVYKCLNKIGHHTIEFPINQQAINTRNNTNLKVVRCRLECTKQRVEFMGSREFNNLPQTLKSANTISLFKSLLNNYLLQNSVQILS